MKSGLCKLFCLAAGLFACSAAIAAGPAPFIYKSPSGTVFKVTGQGLSSISVASSGLPVAKGSWYFKAPGGLAKAATLKSDGAAHATVVQNYGDCVATFDYTFAADTVEIRAKVENNSMTKPIDEPTFQGLVCGFGGIHPTGILMQWSDAQLRQIGEDAYYPSRLNPIGGSAAIGNGFGVGLSPANPRLMRTLFDWAPVDDGPARMLKYRIKETIPAEGARTYVMKMKVSALADWKTLLQPYSEYFRATFGGIKFAPNSMPVAVAVIKSSAATVSTDNPYGYSDKLRRFDKTDVVKDYLDSVLPGFKKAGCQALVFRGLAGYDPKGLEWLPYFNNLPPEIDDPAKPDADLILKQMTTACSASGVQVGVCGQPNALDERVTWTRNEAIRLNPNDPGHLDAMWNMRIKYFLDRGVTTFNFENFGSSFEDVAIMKYLREKMGKDKLTFVSQPCDVMLLYSGAYTVATYDEKQKRYTLDIPEQTLEVFRWLVPNSQIAVRYYELKPIGTESPIAWTFRMHMTPMLPDTTIGANADELKTMVGRYLNELGQWLE